MPLTDEQQHELELLKLKLEAEEKKRAGRQKFWLGFLAAVYPILFMVAQYILNVLQTADIETTQQKAAIQVKSELVAAAVDVKKSVAVAAAKQDEQLEEIKESADVAALQSSSANVFAAKDFYATEKMIEDMPPAKSADP